MVVDKRCLDCFEFADWNCDECMETGKCNGNNWRLAEPYWEIADEEFAPFTTIDTQLRHKVQYIDN